ncbi:oligosaccharide flippase family protein [Vibrio ziniensis]|uniref:Oligosaccharide flippase family protein n=1 Tax=Vibrio ziniensis TaxID=2711221 RepID=A0A6G7CMJ9_9VIBR|nr:oligosaccharide flippase family protein [Vibrio ziniensis]QIH43304.1 oligosaccharide flippase family protein [Vibrio ziniensis]
MDESLNKRMAIGYLWNLVAKWANRLIGIISTLILVRLLSPADFGIASLTSIIIALFITVSEIGTDKYVIKAKQCTDDLLNSAWSLNLALKCFCSLFIVAFSEPLANWMAQPELQPVLLLCCVIPLLGALKNIGLVQYERELNYFPLTRLATTVKLIVFPVTICLALWLRNYWALIIGIVVNETFTLIGSYFIHPYRPRWSMNEWGKQWDFSKWMLLSTITGYIRSRIDVLLLGKLLPSGDVGTYRISQEFAWLPFSELIAPATSSLYSGISKISHNRDTLHDKIAQYLSVAYMLVVPSAVGIYALNKEIVNVVLGEQWQTAAPILGILSLLMLSMPLNIALQTALISLSKVKQLVIIDIVMVACIVVGFSYLGERSNTTLYQYATYRVSLVVLFIALLFVAYKWILGMSLTRVLSVFVLPFFPALIMYKAIDALLSNIYFSEPINLVLAVAVGAVVFIPVMIGVVYSVRRMSPDYFYLHSLLLRLKAAISVKVKNFI